MHRNMRFSGGFFWFKYCQPSPKAYFLNSQIISSTLQVAKRETKTHMCVRSLLGSFLLLVLFTHLPEYTSLLFHRILDHFLLPLLFPTPILSTSPTSPRSTHIPFLPLTQKLEDTKNCLWLHGQKEAFIFLSHFFNPGGSSVPARSSSDSILPFTRKATAAILPLSISWAAASADSSQNCSPSYWSYDMLHLCFRYFSWQESIISIPLLLSSSRVQMTLPKTYTIFFFNIYCITSHCKEREGLLVV